MMAVVDVGGVGYEVRVPLSTLEVVREGADVLLYTRLLVREDDLRLYGFATEAERHVFDRLVSVAGIGPAIALAALSSMSVGELVLAIGGADVRALERIRGVGKRLAERLVVELKDRLDIESAPASARESQWPPPSSDMRGPPLHADAVQGLVALGYAEKEAGERVARAWKRVAEGGATTVSLSLLIREALQSG
jgi:Holliday junction DNA helicase RuvA